MDINTAKGKRRFYRANGKLQYQKFLDEVSVSNGACWSLNNRKMYYQDSPLKTISSFDFDTKKEVISEREEVIKVPNNMGDSDGNILDAIGMIWMANWGKACVSKWNPHTGQMLQKVDVPTYNVTSVSFGGKNLEDLYITSPSLFIPEDKVDLYPDAGKIFAFTPGVKGIIAIYFEKEE